MRFGLYRCCCVFRILVGREGLRFIGGKGLVFAGWGGGLRLPGFCRRHGDYGMMVMILPYVCMSECMYVIIVIFSRVDP